VIISLKEWKAKVRSIGKGRNYVRFNPNPGFAFVFKKVVHSWSIKKGYRKEEIK